MPARKSIEDKTMVKVMTAIKVLLSILLLIACARILFTGRRVRQYLAPASASATAMLSVDTQNQQLPKAVDYEAILQADLFDMDEEAPVVSQIQAAPSTREISQTHGLTLVGTVTGPPTVARAIVQNSNTQDTKVYRLDESMAGSTLKAIRKDEVVLERNGKQVILRRTSGSGAAAQESPLPSTPVPSSEELPFKSVTVPLPSDSQASTLETFLNQAKIQPHRVNGQTEGLEISGLDKVPAAKKLGLRDGDIIRVINGQTMTSRQKAFQVFRKARSQSELDIELTREGKSKTLSFNMN